MFNKVTALSRDNHRALRFNPRQTYHFAKAEMAVPILANEVDLIAREYPIVFASNAGGLPMALLSLEKEANAYVTPNGNWAARYVPAHIRRFPFMLADSTGNEDTPGHRTFSVMIDTDAPHLQEAAGQPLFNDAGEPSPVLQKVQTVLIDVQRQSLQTLKLIQQIDAAGLLVERVLESTKKGGEPFALKGMRVVDAKKLGALPPETVQALHVSGALHLIHAHFLSLSNLRDGQLAKGQATDGAQLNGNKTDILATDGTLNLSAF